MNSGILFRRFRCVLLGVTQFAVLVFTRATSKVLRGGSYAPTTSDVTNGLMLASGWSPQTSSRNALRRERPLGPQIIPLDLRPATCHHDAEI